MALLGHARREAPRRSDHEDVAVAYRAHRQDVAVVAHQRHRFVGDPLRHLIVHRVAVVTPEDVFELLELAVEQAALILYTEYTAYRFIETRLAELAGAHRREQRLEYFVLHLGRPEHHGHIGAG